MGALSSAVRYSLRSLARNPGFAAVTVLVLTLGIGATTTLFTLFNGIYLAPPPQVAEPEGLVRFNRVQEEHEGSSWSYPDFAYFREQAAELLDLTAYSGGPQLMTATLSEKPVEVAVTFVADNYFDVLGVRMAAGRGFVAEENQVSGSPPAVVLSHAFWQRAYGGAADAVGAVLVLNRHPLAVVGVAPPGFRGISPFETPPDVWTPTAMQPVLSSGSTPFNPLVRQGDLIMVWLRSFGRPRPGVELGLAQEKVDALSAALAQELPNQWERSGARLRPTLLDPQTAAKADELMRLLAAVVALVLAIATANAALLLLARASARRREIGVRLALGAGRSRIFFQLLADSLVLALVAGLGGFVVAFWSAGLAVAPLPFEVVGLAPDARVLAFTLAVSLVTAVAFGLVPAWQTARVHVLSIIRQGDALAGRSIFRNTLVIGQIALSIVLVTASALFVRSLDAAASVDLGFEAENRIAVQVNLRPHGYDDETARAYVERALAETEAVAGVRRSTAMAIAPFRGMMMTGARPEGRAADETVDVEANYVGPGYFATLGIPLVDGRDLTAEDRAGAAVVVISETAAAKMWPGEPAIGRRLSIDGRDFSVVGVAPDVRYRDLEGELRPYVYLPLLDGRISRVTLVAETEAAPRTVVKAVEERMREIDPDVAVSHASMLSDNVERVLAPYRIGATLVSFCGVLGLVLAAVGLYGVLSYLVVRATRVIGIRMALGATARQVALGVVGRGLGLAAVGIPIGLGAAWLASRLVAGFLFQVDARDPLAFTAAPLVIVAVVALASWLPAWRAASIEPMEALREE